MRESQEESSTMVESTIPNKDSENSLSLNSLNMSKKNNNQRRENSYNISRINNEDSIVYFAKKLENKKYDYKIYSYCCLILHFLDFIICLNNKQFKFLYNQIILLLLIISLLYYLLISRNNFELLSKKIYKSIKTLIFIQSIILLFLYADLFHIIFKKTLFKKLERDDIQSNMDFLLGTFMPYLVLIIANLILPGFLFVKLIQIKKCIKKLNYVKGEDYQMVKIRDF